MSMVVEAAGVGCSVGAARGPLRGRLFGDERDARGVVSGAVVLPRVRRGLVAAVPWEGAGGRGWGRLVEGSGEAGLLAVGVA